MSEFDQEDGHKKWFANPDFNPAQCNVVAAEHRENRTTAERHTGDYDCLGQLIDPKSRWPDFDCARQHNVRPPSYDKKIGLVLQGGGALGSYQAGVYEALASSEYLPDWVAGISIGAINAAIIVGNRPENRVKCLRSFWEEVTAQTQSFAVCADWLTRLATKSGADSADVWSARIFHPMRTERMAFAGQSQLLRRLRAQRTLER